MQNVNLFNKENKSFSFEVSTEEELIDKVSECMKALLLDQKIEFTFKSHQNQNLEAFLCFGYREGAAFKEPDVNVRIYLTQNSEEVFPPSNIRYNIKTCKSIKNKGEGWSSFSTSESVMLGRKSWKEEDRKKYIPLNQKEALGFWELVEQTSIDSNKKLLHSSTSKKLHSIVSSKLKELQPIPKGSLVIADNWKSAIESFVNRAFDLE